MDLEKAVRSTLTEIVSSVVPGTGWLTDKVLDRVAREHEQRASKALRVAENASGMSREELADLLDGQPELVPLYLQVLYAAGMNGHEQVLRAMGAAMGLAAAAARSGDGDSFDDIELALRAMKDFTPRQFQVLQAIVKSGGAKGDDGEDDLLPTGAPGISASLGISVERAEACLISLSGLGLVTVVQTWGGNSYPIAPLGRAVVAAADAVAE